MFDSELTNDEERDSNNEWACRDIQNEIEDYELHEQEDPFPSNNGGVYKLVWIL